MNTSSMNTSPSAAATSALHASRAAMHRRRKWVNNVALLLSRGVRLVGPDDGPLAEGESGPGRMAAPEQIVAALGAWA